MKALVISDIHGSGYYADKIREIVERENPEKIILLGDLYYHGPRNDLSQEYNPMKVAETLNSMKDKLLVIRGNCDAEVDEMISEFKFNDHILMEINGKKFYFTHGHKYNIENIPYDDFDIMIYGHIHQGFIEEKEGLIFANPGSISLPKSSAASSHSSAQFSFLHDTLSEFTCANCKSYIGGYSHGNGENIQSPSRGKRNLPRLGILRRV